MDDAKENNVAADAAPGKPSWPLPSPSSTGCSGGGGGVASRKRPSAPAALLGDEEEADDETIPTNRRRAVDLLAHMATTAAVRDLAAALEQLAVPGTAEEARRAAERALDCELKKTMKETFRGVVLRMAPLRDSADQVFSPIAPKMLARNPAFGHL